jgi:hypothetical protein
MRVRHRLSKLLLRQGIVYFGGTPWTCVHEEWLRRQRFDDAHLKAAFDQPTPCWQQPQHGIASMNRSPKWPPHTASLTRSIG